MVLLQTMAWIDDFDDLPMEYEFGFLYGWHRLLSVDRWRTINVISVISC